MVAGLCSKADPKSSLVRSEPTAWMVLLNHATADATFNDDRYLEFCGVLVVRYNGMCACRVNETTTVCSREVRGPVPARNSPVCSPTDVVMLPVGSSRRLN